MRFLFCCIILLAGFLIKAQQNEYKEYYENLLRLDFESCHRIAQKINEEDQLPHFLFLTELFENHGQNLISDKKIVNKVMSNKDLVSELINGVFKLYYDNSNESSYEILVNVIRKARNQNKESILGIAYFAILELYSEEIVQSSKDYNRFLEEFREISSSEYDQAWYLLHKIRYLSKFPSRDSLEVMFKVYDELKIHFSKHELGSGLETHFDYEMGINERGWKNYDQAVRNFLSVVNNSQSYDHLKYLKFSSLIYLVEIESRNRNFTQAKAYLDSARNYWDLSDSIRSEFVWSRFGACYYFEELGMPDSAYKYLRRSNDLEQFLDFRKNTLRISELNVQLRTEEKENEILLQQNEIAARDRWLLLVVVFSLILIGLLVVLAYSFRNIRKKNQQIETLMRELHHRVKNNLQVISSLLGLQSSRLQDETARKAVSEGKGRIRAMSLIHQKLYQKDQVTSLDIRDYITNLVNELAQSYGYSDKAHLDIDVPSINMDADTSLPIGLIINELVSNAFKYAFHDIEQPLLKLRLIQESKKRYSLLVRDNGPGLPPDFKVENATSFGMKLVNLLVRQLKGSLKITNENGVSYQINFELT